VVVITWRTRNQKTGFVAQTWVMRADVDPITAAPAAHDQSVCRDYPLRVAGCCIELGRAPLRVWQTYRDGCYRRATYGALLRGVNGRPIRHKEKPSCAKSRRCT
jgi:hypothetical protein